MDHGEIRAALATLASTSPGGLLRTSDLRHPLLDASTPWYVGLQALSFLKLLWLSVPLDALNPRTPDITPHLVEMANYLYGDNQWASEDLRHLRIIVARIRQYVTIGRRVKALENRRFVALLRTQNGRCNLCGYKFRKEDIDARDYVTEPNFEAQGATLRPPHTDHIIPVFLGGDKPSNLQILCSLCNLSKGSFCGWFESRAGLPARKPSEVWTVTQTERWAVLARDGRCSSCMCKPHEFANDQELTVERVDVKRAWLFENLRAVCTDCTDKCIESSLRVTLDD